MGEEVEERERGESSDELDELRKELLERYPEEKADLPEPDDAQRSKGEEGETSGSELDQLRDEIAHRHPSEEEPA